MFPPDASRLATAAVEAMAARATLEPDEQVLARLDAALADARAAFAASVEAASPLSALVARAHMSVAEAEVFATAVAVETDERLQKLIVAVTADRERHRLELGMLDGLFGADHPGAATIGPASALVRSAFVTVRGTGAFSRQVIAVEPSVLWALAGDRTPDRDLPVGTEVIGCAGDGDLQALLVTGKDRARRREAAQQHVACPRLLVTASPEEDAAWAAVVREATLQAAGVLIEVGDGAIGATGRRWIERARHLVWVLSAVDPLPFEGLPDVGWPHHAWRELDVAATDPTDAEWAAALGAEVARTHRVGAEQLPTIQRIFAAQGGGSRDVDAAMRRMVSPALGQLARRIRPSRGWDDVVLPPAHMAQLRDLVERYRHGHQVYDEWGFAAVPSRGIVALFSGPSGTGKTLSAEVIAGELGVDMFKIDLSAVVSKYIGETEKNMEKVFDAAEGAGTLLFFDEADSLFGKRSETSDAHDRYANLETSYLLQRLEVYEGIVVMATNFEKNIDQAFLRRIHTRVDFALPDARERAAIWRHHLPATAPTDGIDIDRLAASFEISGGSIRNAALAAGFIAAGAQTKITMQCAVQGIAREYRKLGRLIRREEFAEFFDLVA